MKEYPAKYTLIIKKGQGDYLIGSIVELPACHALGKTVEELSNNIKEVLTIYLEVVKPEIITEFIGIRKIDI